MFNSEKQISLKIRPCPRFEKTNYPISRYPISSFRQPFPLVRRRMMAGRYPNIGFRPMGRPAFRSNCFVSRQHSSPRAASPAPEQSRMPLNIPLESQNRGSNPDVMCNPCNQRSAESNECSTELNERNSLSNVWMEALAPSGKKYYYNALSRATTWTIPAHAQIIDMNEMKRLQNHVVRCPQSSSGGNWNSFVQPLTPSSYGNNCFIANIPRFIAFPPPQNLSNPPPVLSVPAPGSIHMNSSLIFNAAVPPPSFPFPIVSGGQIVNNAMIDNRFVHTEEDKQCVQTRFAHSANNEILREKEYKVLDWNISNSETLCLQNNINQENVPVKEQNEQMYICGDPRLTVLHKEKTTLVPPQSFQLPILSGSQIVNNATVDSQVVPAEENKQCSQSHFTHVADSDLKEKEYKFLDRSGSSNETSLYLQNDISQENVPVTGDSDINMPHEDNGETESNSLSLDQQENFIQDFCLSKKFTKEDDEGNGKKRIITSTPIPGTKWHIISRKDDKTYYFDSECNTSVWERPKELVNVRHIIEEMSQNEEVNITGKEQIVTNEPDNCKLKCKTNDSEPNESKSKESECLTMEEQTENQTKQVIDKTRPVSCTLVSGTTWFVVWTGDDKVFYYDSSRKISVWERPVELLNRLDVHKLVEKSPLKAVVIDSKKESRKIESDDSDTTKKIKKEQHENDTELIKESENDNKVAEMGQQKEIPHEDKVKIFCEMLAEKQVSAFSTWEKELHKIVFDSRYLLLCSKDRKQVFRSFITKRIEDEKEERQKQLQIRKQNFISLLKEIGVNSESRFRDIAKLCAKDARFKSIEKMRQREDLFHEYISDLAKKERDREKIKAERRRKFFKLLGEQTFDADTEITWAKMKEKISENERYKAIQSDSAKEELFREYIKHLHSNSPSADRVSTSIRNREKEVERDLSVHLKDREREQKLHKNMSAMSHFQALMNDLIKTDDISWHSAKKLMKRDHRWNLVQYLESEDRKELFDQHIDSLHAKKTRRFHKLLDEIPDLTFKSSWLDVRNAVLSDPRCAKFSSSERKCEVEFKDYMRRKLSVAKAEFQELLRETKIITHQSKSLLYDTNHLRDVEEVLSKDKRYLNLDCVRSDRKEILLSYIDQLHENGPPPPPTATLLKNR